MAPVTPPTIEDLGLPGAYYLAALLSAQERRLPIAPTRRLALGVMDTLKETGVIEVPWPLLRWSICPDAEETPIEHLHWRYNWSQYIRLGLGQALEEYLQSLPRDDYGLALRSRYWNELCVAEAESYFEQQLAKHQFDPTWAQDFIFVHRDNRPALSIAQWRYCCWAATRQGASVAQQQRVAAPALVREAIYNELRHRAARVSTGAWPQCAFPPSKAQPDSALSRLFVDKLSSLGFQFWTLPPNAQDLIFQRQPR